MDRFGILRKNDSTLNNYSSAVDTPLMPSTTVTSNPSMGTMSGFTDGTLFANRGNATYGLNARWTGYYNTDNSTNKFAVHKHNQGSGTKYVEQINEGQITEYPFKIDQRFPIAHTHEQYYQLNLETDSRDTILNDDIVVQYTISDIDGTDVDDYYQSVHNDVRNLYYIYNKGNVTYTGCGDSYVTGEMEKKLFVNTLVAAYNSGIQAPQVSYKDNQERNSTNVRNVYLPFDAAMNTYLEDKVDIYFQISDITIVQANKKMITNYYIETSSSTNGAILVPGTTDTYVLEIKIGRAHV